MDDTTLIAIGMNGRELPRAHGFPARLLSVGTYGMKNPKWLTSIEVVDRPYQGYWEQRGWNKQAIVKTGSRVDVPHSGSVVGREATLAGVAFAGDRGISGPPGSRRPLPFPLGLACGTCMAAGGLPLVQVCASAIGTDSLAIAGRKNTLTLEGAAISSQRAYQQAGVGPQDMDIFELHDAYTIITALSLEAAGFAKPGEGVHFGKDGAIALDGTLPISTMGGLKARGHPVGATGVYQLVETYLQLTGTAGANQIKDPTIALIQNIGGTGATVVSHILAREA